MDEITIKFENRSITASMADLNYIIILAQYASEYMMMKKYFSFAEEASEFADAIYDLLRERGYYEED